MQLRHLGKPVEPALELLQGTASTAEIAAGREQGKRSGHADGNPRTGDAERDDPGEHNEERAASRRPRAHDHRSATTLTAITTTSSPARQSATGCMFSLYARKSLLSTPRRDDRGSGNRGRRIGLDP
jgi:hypothetical protein